MPLREDGWGAVEVDGFHFSFFLFFLVGGWLVGWVGVDWGVGGWIGVGKVGGGDLGCWRGYMFMGDVGHGGDSCGAVRIYAAFENIRAPYV